MKNTDSALLNALIIPESTPANENDIDLLLKNIDKAPQAIPLKYFTRLSSRSKFLMEGTLAILGGGAGSAKSFFALNLGVQCQIEGVKWSYLPLESDREFHLKRLGAILNKSWDILLQPEDDPDYSIKVRNALLNIRADLKLFTSSIFNNPALPREGCPAQSITPEYILKWLEEQFQNEVKVAIIDPLALIDFTNSGHEQWKAENRFIQNLVTLAYKYQSCCVLVVHTNKKVENKRPDISDLQGGASIGRLAGGIIIMHDHEPKESHIYQTQHYTKPVEHNRTIIIAKSRNGQGKMDRLAYNFGYNGATFEEFGIIAPKDKINPVPV